MPFRLPLERRRFLVLDGGLATELERRGADLRDPLWSARVLLEQPALIRAVHLAYLEAGADIITTASYQATFPALARRGLTPRQAEAVLLRSVSLAREAIAELRARGDRDPDAPVPMVAASIGPYGAYLHDGSEYRGDYGLTDRQLADFHRDRLLLLGESGADLLACETIPSRREAEVLADLLERQGKASAWISFSGKDGTRIADGTPFTTCVTALEGSERVIATGVNCTPPELAAQLLESAGAVARKPFVAYPNSGEAYDAETGTWHGRSATDWVSHFAPRFLQSGAEVIGGCCRTDPGAIARLIELRGRLGD